VASSCCSIASIALRSTTISRDSAGSAARSASSTVRLAAAGEYTRTASSIELRGKDDTPYAVLLVELEEGPRMVSSLVGGDPAKVTIDMPVQLVCERINDEITLPRFKPA
jgi:uncharacterized OB-fold protein